MRYRFGKFKKLLMPAAAVLSSTIVFSSVTVPAMAQEPTEAVGNDAARLADADGAAAGNAANNGSESQDSAKAAPLGASSPNSYIDADDNSLTVSEYFTFNKDTNSLLTRPFYVVDSSFDYDKRLTVRTDTNILLCDGVTLNLLKGLTIENGKTLNIWCQSGKTGKLVATTDSDHVASISVNNGSSLVINGGIIEANTKTDDAAGIGGDKGKRAGNITIKGGTVTATAKNNGAGIGGGSNGGSGNIKITGGTVTAKGSSHGAGIGGGNKGFANIIDISGGTVNATGGSYAAGIGGGGDSGADQIYISGGKVNAWGGTESAGIGSANKGHVNTIEITGGRVYAFGEKNAAGIGGGDGNESNGTYGTITITNEGTRVGAYGGDNAAGIGTGRNAKTNNGTINIRNGAWVQAIGGSKVDLIITDEDEVKRDVYVGGPNPYYYEPWQEEWDVGNNGAGIGGGQQTPGGTINISGKDTYVEAYGSLNAAGIGSGDKAGSIGNIDISDAEVKAEGGGMRYLYAMWGNTYGDKKGGAGIGGGRQSGSNADGSITIEGAKVTARGSDYAAGIGGGDEGGAGTIVISKDAVVEAISGKNGAGIGTGDVTNNGKKADWLKGTIEISGTNTQVDAKCGDNGGAGIGGGDDGYGGTITIKDVGRADGATGFVKAVGTGRAAGIGGGPGTSFKKITIDNATVTATGGYGAGIGGGGGATGKQDPAHVNGGDISITNSDVVAVSALGGAGIGGGIFGRADNIDINGGTVMANGGAMFGIEDMPTFAVLIMTDLMNQANFEKGLTRVGHNAYGTTGALGTLVAGLVGTGVTEAFKLISDIFGLDSKPTIIYYTGAGIGGGYKSAGGNINIRGNAAVSAAAGVLPPGFDEKEYKYNSPGIGEGKNYTGNESTSVKIYNNAIVTTGKLALEHTGAQLTTLGALVKVYTPVKSDVQTGPATDTEVMSRVNNEDYQLTVIQPGFAVTFDSNGGSEVFDQTVVGGAKVVMPENPTKEGYSFLGWKYADGSKYFDPETPVTENIDLVAEWIVGDPDSEHQIIIDKSTNGDITTDVQSAKFGTVVTIKVDRSNGYNWEDITVLDNKNEGVEVTEVDENTYTFIMPYSAVYIYADIYGVDPYRVDVKDGAPTVDFGNLSTLAYTVILESVDTQYLLLEVTPLQENKVPKGDKTAITDQVTALGAQTGSWFDLSLSIRSTEDNSLIKELESTEKPIEFYTQIPEELQKEGRTYYIIGIKDGKAQVLAEGEDTEFKWSDNTFGTFLIAYKDGGAAAGEGEKSGTAVTPAGNNPKSGASSNVTGSRAAATGDKDNAPVWIIAAGAATATLAGVIVRRRKKTEDK